jgi:hypothetical protein
MFLTSTNPAVDAVCAAERISSPSDSPSTRASSSVLSPSLSPSDEERMVSRQKWRDAGVLLDPPDPQAAAATATAKRPCLKAPDERNPQWNPFVNDAGQTITLAKCEELVEHMTWKGHWKRVMGESYRTLLLRPAQHYVMEFIVPQNGGDLAPFVQEIKLAGYTHFSLCNHNGWQPFELPGLAKGWGKVVTDYDLLVEWHNNRQFCNPMPHHAGNGWVCRAKHYTQAEYPRANEWGPYGPSGPRWSAVS